MRVNALLLSYATAVALIASVSSEGEQKEATTTALQVVKQRSRSPKLLGLQPVRANANVALTLLTTPQIALNLLQNRMTAVSE